jgi:hypothetical protein
MRIAVVILNLVAFLFISFVLVTDGPPDPGADTVFAVLSLLTKVFSVLMILLTRDGGRWLGSCVRAKALVEHQRINRSTLVISSLVTLAMVCNIVVIGFACWHLAGQYNHPAETGAIPLVLLMVLTPLLSLAVLLRSAPRDTRPGPRLSSSAPA